MERVRLCYLDSMIRYISTLILGSFCLVATAMDVPVPSPLHVEDKYKYNYSIMWAYPKPNSSDYDSNMTVNFKSSEIVYDFKNFLPDILRQHYKPSSSQPPLETILKSVNDGDFEVLKNVILV